MTILYLVKNHFNQLEANDIETENFIGMIKKDELMKVIVEIEDNQELKKRAHKALRLCFNNQDKYDVYEFFRTEVTLRCGAYTHYVTENGVARYNVTSWSDIKGLDFKDFYNKLINVLLKHFIDVSDEELTQEIARF